MQYKIIKRGNQSSFEREVNNHLEIGWELQGGVSHTQDQYGNVSFVQSMIKEDKNG